MSAVPHSPAKGIKKTAIRMAILSMLYCTSFGEV